MRIGGMSAGSRRVYRSAVARWLLAGGTGGHLDAPLLVAYLGERRKRLSLASVNLDITALRRFYTWMAACGHCAHGTADQIPAQRKVVPRLPRTLSEAEVAAVLAAPDASTWHGFRDTVLLRVLCDTGLTTSELAALTLGAVLDDRMLYIVKGHRRAPRYVPISAELAALLDRYIGRRREVRPGKRAALWLTRHGGPFQARSIHRCVSHYIRTVVGRGNGITLLRTTGRPWQGHYPHQLRASLAQHYLERGLDAVGVAQLLGYADVASVARYVGVDLETMRAALAHHPRGLLSS